MKTIWKIIKTLLVLLIIAAALVGLLVLQALRRAEEHESIEEIQQKQGVPVKVVRPVRRDFVDYLYCDGRVEADSRSVLRARVGEIVEAVHAKVGESVQKGQLLVEFRTEDLEAEVEARETAFEEAQNNYERYKTLYEKGHVTAQALEQRRTAMNSAEAALRQARSNLTFARVYSPMDGIVEARNVEPGEFKGVGKELMQVVDLSDMVVQASVPEEFVGRLAEGDRAGYRLEGREEWRQVPINRISPSTLNSSRFFDVFLQAQNGQKGPGWELRHGMYAEVRFPRDRVESVLAVPRHSLRRSGGQYYVLTVQPGTEEVAVPVNNPAAEDRAEKKGVLDRARQALKLARSALAEYIPQLAEEKARGKQVTRTVDVLLARRVPVEIGFRGDGFVQVSGADISPESRIIANPVDDLRDGEKVSIEDGEESPQ